MAYPHPGTATAGALYSAVADVAALKGLTGMLDRLLVYVEATQSWWSYDLTGTGTSDDILIATPTVGAGRWFNTHRKVDDAPIGLGTDGDASLFYDPTGGGAGTGAVELLAAARAAGSTLPGAGVRLRGGAGADGDDALGAAGAIGGRAELLAGAGGDADGAAGAAGAGAPADVFAGAGGAASGAGQVGANGGAATVAAGDGGAALAADNAGDGGSATVRSGDGGDGSAGGLAGDGGATTVRGGHAGAAGAGGGANGGSALLQGGSGSGAFDGGRASVQGGAGGTTGDGGNVVLTGGLGQYGYTADIQAQSPLELQRGIQRGNYIERFTELDQPVGGALPAWLTATQRAGLPVSAFVAASHVGEHQTTMPGGVATYTLDSFDDLWLNLSNRPIIEMRVKLATAGVDFAHLDDFLVMGVGSAYNADPDLMTYCAWFKAIATGAVPALLWESDDNTAEARDQACVPAQTLTKDTYFVLRIDFTTPTAPRFYVNGVHVATAAMAALPANTMVQPYIHLRGADATSTADVVTVDYINIVAAR